jgi:hypothetical protein
MSYPRNRIEPVAPIEPYGLPDFDPRGTAVIAIVTVYYEYQVSAKLELGMALEPSIGMKDMAKTKIEKERIGAALKINRFASCGTISSLVRSFMKSASG